MALPFAPSTWVARAPVQPPVDASSATQHVDVAILDQSTGHLLVAGATVPAGQTSPGRVARQGWMKRSRDFGGSWVTEYNSVGPLVNAHAESGRIGDCLFAIQSPAATHFYRFRIVHVASFFVDDATLFPGAAILEQSSFFPDFPDHAAEWFPVQTFYSWPQVNKVITPGAGSAQVSFSAKHCFIPGSGPNGADADWLLVACRIASNPNVLISEVFLWRSDDFGYSWVKVHDVTSGFDPSSPILHFERSPSGRLHANESYSDDGGMTWTPISQALGFSPNDKVFYYPGGTAAGLRLSSLVGQAAMRVSCDGGVTWPHGVNLPNGSGVASSVQLSPQELIVVSQPMTFWSDTGGETLIEVGHTPILTLDTGCRFVGLLPNTTRPIIVGVNGSCGFSQDSARGSVSPRTVCPLAHAGIARVAPLKLCGAPIIPENC